MRRIDLTTILLALPVANALSLANFQFVTGVSRTCVVAYNNQIPACTVDDFNNGCSNKCKSALRILGETVVEACSTVTVGTTTLMGKVKDGGIVEALCLADTSTSRSVQQPTLTPVIPQPSSTATSANSKTSTTKSPGVIGGGGTKTSTRSSTTAVQTSVENTRESTTSAIRTSSSEQPNSETSTAQSTASTDQASATDSSNSAEVTSAQSSNSDGSGGGSPFDTSSGARYFDSMSAVKLAIAVACIIVLFGW